MVGGEKKRVEGVIVLKEKSARKKSTRKPKNLNSIAKKNRMTAAQREEMLIENFVGLQKAMVNLSIKFENLSDNISKLLNVFEISARDYMINKGRTTPDVDRDILNRVNMLIDQNKNIIGNMRAMEDKMKRQPTNNNPIPQPQPSLTLNPQYTQSSTPAKPKTIVETI